MKGSVVNIDKYRKKKNKMPIVTEQEEAEIYANELTNEFLNSLNVELKGGAKNECISKNDRKRT